MRYRAILLDFDNTVIGTENSNFHIFKETVEKLIKREMTREDSANFAGLTWKGIFENLSSIYLPDRQPAELRKVFVDAKKEYFKNRKVAVAEGLQDICSLDIKKAIVTGSCRAEVFMFENIIDFSKFDLIATDDLYDAGKPAPDAYLYASKALGVEPGEALAVEDSVIGLTSAKSAGCSAVFTREFSREDHSSLADFTVSRMSEVLRLL